MNIKLNSVSRFSSYRTVDTCFSAIKPNQLILREEIIAACSEKRTLHKTTLCAEFNFKPGGTYINHLSLSE
jgi:hypothetical protein